MDVQQDLSQIRNEICNLALVTGAILGIPACLASLSRLPTIGWHWVIGMHCAGALGIVIFALFRKSLPYALRAGFLVSVATFIGISDLAKFGLLAPSIPMLVSAPIIASFLFTNRVAVSCVVLTFVSSSAIAYGHLNRILNLPFDTQNYLTLKSAWVDFILVTLLSIGVCVAAGAMIQRHLTNALKSSLKRQDELKQMVKERTKELEQAKCKAEQLARTDELTGLHNRRAFMECAQVLHKQAQRYRQSYVLLMIDIDFFKRINDTWGHCSGDAVLRIFGKLIDTQFRSTDLTARIGGEEFLIMLPQTGMEEAMKLAEKFRKKVQSSRLETPAGAIRYTCSIGASEFDLSGSLQQEISNTDVALYRAKQNGRNQAVCFHEVTNQ